MKKIILIFSFIFALHSGCISQIDYPRYQKDSLGQTVVMMTIAQAQWLDNNTDLLSLFKKLDDQILDYDSICIKVLNDKDAVIVKQTIQIQDLKESSQIKSLQILNLQTTITNNELKASSLEKELLNKNAEIAIHVKQVKKTKRKAMLGGALSGLTIIGLILAIIAIK